MELTNLISYLNEIDTTVFLFFNGIHAPFWDIFMKTFTGTFIWVPLYASLMYLLLKNFHWKEVVCYTVAIALAITLADQLCSSLIRPEVARLRPANPNSPIVDLVHIVNGYRGGRYGFPSCHAANSFALLAYVLCTFRNRLLTLFFLAWAVVNCYTRLYLGVHYPGDLLVGALIGGGLGLLCSTLGRKAALYWEPQAPNRGTVSHTAVPIGIGLITLTGIFIYTLICM